MLNPFDILQTKISFLVLKAMGALPDAEAGWVQAFPCCFGAWFVEVPCRGPAYVSWGYLENVIRIRNDIIRFLCIFVLPFQLLHWYFNGLTWRFSPSYIFLAFEGHLSQKKHIQTEVSFCLFQQKVVIFVTIFLIIIPVFFLDFGKYHPKTQQNILLHSGLITPNILV